MARKRNRSLNGYHDPQKVMNAPGWGIRNLRLSGQVYRDGQGYKGLVCISNTGRTSARRSGRMKCGTGKGASPSKALASAARSFAKTISR